MPRPFGRLAVALLASAALSAPLHAQVGGPVPVLGTASIYKASNNDPAVTADHGTSPLEILLNPGTGRVLSFSSITGTWSCGANFAFSADGLNSAGAPCLGPANIEASGGISAFATPGRSMSLVGVFLGTNGITPPAGPPPGPINYGSVGYNFTSMSGIVLGQVFFIGDGRTTDVLGANAQTGAIQNFFVPDAATRLYLGAADACGMTGSPNCYQDNFGSLSVTYAIVGTTVPEPSTYALLAAGLGALGLFARRRRQV